MACDWLSIVWTHSNQETENEPLVSWTKKWSFHLRICVLFYIQFGNISNRSSFLGCYFFSMELYDKSHWCVKLCELTPLQLYVTDYTFVSMINYDSHHTNCLQAWISWGIVHISVNSFRALYDYVLLYINAGLFYHFIENYVWWYIAFMSEKYWCGNVKKHAQDQQLDVPTDLI